MAYMKDCVSVELVSMEQACGITVVFSDGTYAHYPPEELVALRPHREFAGSMRGSLVEVPTA